MNARTMQGYAAAVTIAAVSAVWLGVAGQIHSKHAKGVASTPVPAPSQAQARDLAQAQVDRELARVYLQTAAAIRTAAHQRANAQQTANARQAANASASPVYAQASTPAAAPAAAPVAASGGS